MKMRNMIAAISAMAVSAACVAAMPAFAADKTIAYTASEGSLGVGDNGTSLRRNIYNVWGNSVTDIDGATAVNDHVTVNFNVSGIGSDSADPESGDAYYVFLGGSIAGVSAHQSDYDNGSVPQGQFVNITGDGSYSVTWSDTNSENIDCLYLQSNINIYAYGEDKDAGTKATCVIDVTSIVTDDGVEEEPTTEATTTTTEGASTTTTTGGGSTTKAGSTTTKSGSTTTAAKNNSNSASTTTAATTTNTATGDNSGIAVAVAALAVAGGALVASRKRK